MNKDGERDTTLGGAITRLLFRRPRDFDGAQLTDRRPPRKRLVGYVATGPARQHSVLGRLFFTEAGSSVSMVILY
jgi:hypothetical protein